MSYTLAHMETQAQREARERARHMEVPRKECAFSLRMSRAQYDKLKELGGGAWIRLQLNKAKVKA